jgi:hypothetical protein
VREVSTGASHYYEDDWRESITYSNASVIMGTLVQHCPHITRLSLFPHYNSSETFRSNSCRTAVHPKLWHKSLTSLPELRHLSITVDWLYPACLSVLAGLHKLESIYFYSGTLDRSYGPLTKLVLGCTAFASLRKLLFCCVDPVDVVTILSIRPLVRCITELEIDLGLTHHDLDEPDQWITYELLPLLEHTPQLKHLSIKQDEVEEDEEFSLEEPEILDVMAALPLETVYLDSMHLGEGALDFNPGVIWQNVTRLSLPSQEASLQELAYFATMPYLSYLKVGLNLSTMDTPEKIPLSRHAPLTVLESSEQCNLSNSFLVMMHSAE